MQSRMMQYTVLGAALLTLMARPGAAQSGKAGQEAKARKAQVLNAELFGAIRAGDIKGADTALARGADPNGRNWLGFTPLMWAANRGNRQIVEKLLARHAELNGSSVYGAPISYALIGRREDIALYLMEKGASIQSVRADRATPLMLAAGNGQLIAAKRLLAKKDNPNAMDVDGASPLIYAARNGHADVIKALILAGARVNAVDNHGRTALMYAAANGRAESVEVLLANKAQVNAQDKMGATALTLAARHSGSLMIVRSLLGHGASDSLKDGRGATALTLAEMRGYDETAKFLRKSGASIPDTMPVAVTAAQAGPAIERSLTLLQKGMKTYASRAQCVSCHHQGIGMMALGTAKQNGFAVDKELLGSYLKQIGEDGQKSGPFIHLALHDANVAKTIPAVDIGDISIGAGYIFGGLIANGIPSNPGFQEMAQFLTMQQAPDGHWGFGMMREPVQSSYLTTTALVLQVLRTYGSEDKPGQIAGSIDRAKHWLLTTPAPNTEDKASRLLGIKWAGASKEEREKSVQDLLAAQRPDGGWAQLPSSASDAYATGIALYALHIGGELSTDATAYQKGVQFLLRTQEEDGSWYVNKRANPANTYFDAGFPHGESQYVSFAATCWATMALVQGNDANRSASR